MATLKAISKTTSLFRPIHFGRALHSQANNETPSARHISSINSSEIAFFSRLSSQWWDERGEFGFLHKMNPVRMEFITDKVLEITRDEQGEEVTLGRRSILEGLDVLDVGCGGGLLSESLARLGASTLGVDASESNIGIATLHASADPKLASSSNLTYRHTSAEDLLTEPKRFDVVCSMEVIEHVDNPAAFLSTCAELVKPGGHLFLSTIARTPLSYLLTIVAAEQILRKVSPGTHTFSKFINPSELVSFFQKYRSPLVEPSAPSPSGNNTKTSPPSRPWISQTHSTLPTRTEAEIRGLVYIPWKARWELMSREASAYGAAKCNYVFWVRKPYN